MSISSTGLYGSATIVNSDLFNDVESLKERVTTLSTSYLDTTREHREDISQNRQDILQNSNKINDISGNRIPALESDISDNLSKINDLSNNRIKDIEDNITVIEDDITDISSNKDFIRHLQSVIRTFYVCVC
jgi:hypothetical protein